MVGINSALLITALLTGAFANASRQIKFLPDHNENEAVVISLLREVDGKCTILKEESNQIIKGDKSSIRRFPSERISEEYESSSEFIQILAVDSNNYIEEILHSECNSIERPGKHVFNLPASEVRPIVYSGDPSNRIDLVLMCDGYTSAEREKCFEDMKRQTNDMFTGDTFAPYLPVFNVWAVWLESNESGIGAGGKPKDTALGLYRDGTELRGIYCSKKSDARNACKLTGANACDYPGIIANDKYYGGLGGEFLISTSSESTGNIVFRHEAGHNFGNVGEEYDGGSVYSGSNNSPSLSNIKWKSWLTDGPTSTRVQRMDHVAQDYSWHDLDKSGPYSISFTSTGEYDRWASRFSISGIPDDNLLVYVDGLQVNWTSQGLEDRSFYELAYDVGFTKGRHNITFEVKGNAPQPGKPIRQLCNILVQEYGNEDTYNTDPDFIGLYPTYNVYGRQAGYRSNHETCLMRNMTSPLFCSPCLEGMWREFFMRVSLIDDLKATVSGSMVNISLETLKLGQFRTGQQFPGERMSISWYLNGQLLSAYTDMTSFSVPFSGAQGQWRVLVKFTSPMIRDDPKNLSQSEKYFIV